MLEELAAQVATQLEERGWCVVDDALPAAVAAALASECCALDAAGFRSAGIGRGGAYQRDVAVRSDVIRWIDGSQPAGSRYLALMEALRGALNSRLFLGLFDYECHYARYAPGAFYRRHVDAFVGEKNRVLSTVFYLNEDWKDEEGGELQLYIGEGNDTVETVMPHRNRLVIFLSERFPHEVKPATRERRSIAGWFRVRA